MAKKKAFQAPPPAAQVGPQPRHLPPPPIPAPVPVPKEIYYPSSDGKLLADNTWQSRTMIAKYDMLYAHYMDDPSTYVAISLLLYYTEGEPADVVAPDLFVARGVPNRHRDWYKVWEEGKVPDFVLEVSSEATAEDNLGRNMETYARIGISEYCVYDPMGGLHFPRLQLFRLSEGEDRVYEQVQRSEGSDGSLAVPSESLGLELRLEDDRLHLWDPAAREYLLEYAEERDRRLKERAGRMREHTRRVAAEERVAKLKIELADVRRRLRERRQRSVP